MAERFVTRKESGGITPQEAERRDLGRIFGINFTKLPFTRAIYATITHDDTLDYNDENQPRIPSWWISFAIGGQVMEEATAMMNASKEQLREARKELEQTANQIKVLKETIFPELVAYAQEIRTMRMTAVSEMSQILNEMRQVHKFFIDSSYEREMKELERFVGLCKEIQALKRDGVFDAICDSAIRLAVKEPT